jgi:hypothetical protein
MAYSRASVSDGSATSGNVQNCVVVQTGATTLYLNLVIVEGCKGVEGGAGTHCQACRTWKTHYEMEHSRMVPGMLGPVSDPGV